jgi:membrane associated rhomboid family serine protease
MSHKEDVMGFGTSIVLIAAGAILRFAVSVTTTGFNLHTIGLILIIVGAVSLLLSIVFWNSWGGFGGSGGGSRRQRRVTRDGAGGYVEEERADVA